VMQRCHGTYFIYQQLVSTWLNDGQYEWYQWVVMIFCGSWCFADDESFPSLPLVIYIVVIL
jgi:hypothetical protein